MSSLRGADVTLTSAGARAAERAERDPRGGRGLPPVGPPRGPGEPGGAGEPRGPGEPACSTAYAVVRHDLRGGGAARTLRYRPGDVVVVSGLPGGGKSTLMRRAVPARAGVIRIDSQDMRERWERRMPRRLPYGLYRPLVRLAHYAALRAALASGASVVVHDCGTQSWVRRWLARDALRRGRSLHLLLLDVSTREALSGQAARGRGVSGYAFRRHLRAVRRLRAAARAGRLPRGCVSSVLLDRAAAGTVRALLFEPLPGGVPMAVTAHVRPVPKPAPADPPPLGDGGPADGRMPEPGPRAARAGGPAHR
ncbi:hypothetical protein HMPREF1486_03032 [Streptomyces sp. HPH0547]|nr:hypothetical protein HMPREF1486_03032 [Streptomyces sp. HPH0547]